MAAREEQVHNLENNDTITIVRKSGRWGHTYIVDGSEPMSSATSLIGHIDSGAFQIGMNWAMKVARENDGDLEAPTRIGNEALTQGNALHADIEAYINSNEVNEENPAFISWLRAIGTHWDWIASEIFLYHPTLLYGGTADAISEGGRGNGPMLWDWKTKDPVSYAKNGGSLKDHAQVAGYAMALREMRSANAPEYAKIAYVMRDGSGVDIVDVDIEESMALFTLAGTMKSMVADLKHMAMPPKKRGTGE